MKANEVLSKNEIQDLLSPSNFLGWVDVATTWFLIAASFYLVAWDTNPITILIALFIIGGRQLALAILMHDAAHFALFKSRWMNDFFGEWLCAAPVWHHLDKYRVHHLNHHKYAGSEKDPDYSLIEKFPISQKSFLRKCARDILGISGVKRLLAQFLMDTGYYQYTVAAKVERETHPYKFLERVKMGLRNIIPFVITNLILFLILFSFGHGKLYWLWVVAYLTTFSLFVRIRSIAEHACTDMDLDPLRSTRTTKANIIARLSVAPHHVNFHLEHHFLMTVPSYRFKKFHQILKERGVFENGHYANGYWEVIKLAIVR